MMLEITAATRFVSIVASVATAWLTVNAVTKAPEGAKAVSIAIPSNAKSAKRGRSRTCMFGRTFSP
jgi:hypothetical protein